MSNAQTQPTIKIRFYSWEGGGFVHLFATLVKARVKIKAQGCKRSTFHDEIRFTPEQAEQAINENRLFLCSTDREEIIMSTTQSFYRRSANRKHYKTV